jgi:hypothetical protein
MFRCSWHLTLFKDCQSYVRPTDSRPVCLGVKHKSGSQDTVFITVRHLGVCWYGSPSLIRGRVSRLQLLMALPSAVVLGSESRRTRDSPNLEGKVPVFTSPPWKGVPSYTPRHWVPFLWPPTTRRATVEVFEPLSTLEFKDWVRARVRVTLRLAVYRLSLRLGAKPLEDHDQRFFLQLSPCGHSPYITSSLTRRWVCLLWICLVFRQVYLSDM